MFTLMLSFPFAFVFQTFFISTIICSFNHPFDRLLFFLFCVFVIIWFLLVRAWMPYLLSLLDTITYNLLYLPFISFPSRPSLHAAPFKPFSLIHYTHSYTDSFSLFCFCLFRSSFFSFVFAYFISWVYWVLPALST